MLMNTSVAHPKSRCPTRRRFPLCTTMTLCNLNVPEDLAARAEEHRNPYCPGVLLWPNLRHPSHFGRMSRTVQSSHANTITSNSDLTSFLSSLLLSYVTLAPLASPDVHIFCHCEY